MKQIKLGGQLPASQIALGCMRMSELDERAAQRLIETAVEKGINFFDHADIYGGGASEEIFAAALAKSGLSRGDILLQSKCGICDGFYDFSKEHILRSVEGSLSRLRTEYLDVLLLHRPDPLMEPEEVAEAFDLLQASGKVRYFGVSNQTPGTMELLRKSVRQPLIVNQLQFGVAHTGMIDSGVNMNMKNDRAVDRDGGILEYCRLHDITIQPWSPFQHGFFEGVFLNSQNYSELNQYLDELSELYGVAEEAVAVAWINRHPANMQTIVGTTRPERLSAICEAGRITLTREQWYGIYRAAGNELP